MQKFGNSEFGQCCPIIALIASIENMEIRVNHQTTSHSRFGYYMTKYSPALNGDMRLLNVCIN